MASSVGLGKWASVPHLYEAHLLMRFGGDMPTKPGQPDVPYRSGRYKV